MSRTAIAAFSCVFAPTCASAQTTLAGRIVGVTDGDTLTLLDDGKQQHRIRLEGIDAPESRQAFGTRAKQSLSDLAFDLRTEATCPKTDRYGRRICKVTVGNTDVGLEQIRRGMAWHFKRYEKEQVCGDALDCKRSANLLTPRLHGPSQELPG